MVGHSLNLARCSFTNVMLLEQLGECGGDGLCLRISNICGTARPDPLSADIMPEGLVVRCRSPQRRGASNFGGCVNCDLATGTGSAGVSGESPRDR
jgi:hypothetical protein